MNKYSFNRCNIEYTIEISRDQSCSYPYLSNKDKFKYNCLCAIEEARKRKKRNIIVNGFIYGFSTIMTIILFAIISCVQSSLGSIMADAFIGTSSLIFCIISILSLLHFANIIGNEFDEIRNIENIFMQSQEGLKQEKEQIDREKEEQDRIRRQKADKLITVYNTLDNKKMSRESKIDKIKDIINEVTKNG